MDAGVTVPIHDRSSSTGLRQHKVRSAQSAVDFDHDVNSHLGRKNFGYEQMLGGSLCDLNPQCQTNSPKTATGENGSLIREAIYLSVFCNLVPGGGGSLFSPVLMDRKLLIRHCAKRGRCGKSE